jgi:hypothetical protein
VGHPIKEWKRKIEAARVCKLNRKTMDQCEKRQQEGRLTVTRRKVYKLQKLDPEALREYMKFHPDKILKEIGQAFGANDASVLYRIR